MLPGQQNTSKGLSETVISRSDLAKSYYGFGKTYVTGNVYIPHKALEYFDKALELNPSKAKLHYEYGLVQLTEEHYHDAIERFDRAIQLNENHYGAYVNRAKAKLELKLYSQAIEDFNFSNKYGNKSTSDYLIRGFCKYLAGLYSEAIEDFLNICEPSFDSSYKYFLWSCERSSDRFYSHSEIDYQNELKEQCANYSLLGLSFFQLGNRAAGIEHLNSCRALLRFLPSIDEALWYLFLGFSKYYFGEYEEGVEDLKNAFGIDLAYSAEYHPLTISLMVEYIQNFEYTLNPDSHPAVDIANLITVLINGYHTLFHKVDNYGLTLYDYAQLYDHKVLANYTAKKRSAANLPKIISSITFATEESAKNYIESGGNANFFGDLYEYPIVEGSTAGLSYLFKARKRIHVDDINSYIDNCVADFGGDFESRLADKKLLDKIASELTSTPNLSELFEKFKLAYLGNALSLDGMVLDEYLQMLSGMDGSIFLSMRARILLEMIVTEKKSPGKLTLPKELPDNKNALHVLTQELADTLEILRVHRNVDACKDRNTDSGLLRAAVAQNILKQIALLKPHESYTVYGESSDHTFYITFERSNSDILQLRIDNLGKECSYIENGETIYRHPHKSGENEIQYFLPCAFEIRSTLLINGNTQGHPLKEYLQTVLDPENPDLYAVLYNSQFAITATSTEVLTKQGFRFRRELITGNCVSRIFSVEQEKRLGIKLYQWFCTDQVKFLHLKNLYKFFHTNPLAKGEFIEIMKVAKEYVKNALEVLSPSSDDNNIEKNSELSPENEIQQPIFAIIEAEIASADGSALVKEAEDSGYKPIHIAVLFGDQERITRIVEKNPKALLEETPAGKLPIDVACESDNADVIRQVTALAKAQGTNIASNQESTQQKLAEVQYVTSLNLIFTFEAHQISNQTRVWEGILNPDEFANAENNLSYALRNQFNVRDISFMAFLNMNEIQKNRNSLTNAGAIFTLDELKHRVRVCFDYNANMNARHQAQTVKPILFTSVPNDPWNKHKIRRLIANIKSFMHAYNIECLVPETLNALKDDAKSKFMNVWTEGKVSEFKTSVIDYWLIQHLKNYDSKTTTATTLLDSLYQFTQVNSELKNNQVYKNKLLDQYIALLIECLIKDELRNDKIYANLLNSLNDKISDETLPESLKSLIDEYRIAVGQQKISFELIDTEISRKLLQQLANNEDIRRIVSKILKSQLRDSPTQSYIAQLHKQATLMVFKNHHEGKYALDATNLDDILALHSKKFMQIQIDHINLDNGLLDLLFQSSIDSPHQALRAKLKEFILDPLTQMQSRLEKILKGLCEPSCEQNDEITDKNVSLSFSK